VELQHSLEKIRKRGLGVAAVSYDSVSVLKTFAQRRGISYPLLSDAESKVIRAYGLLNQSVSPDSPQFGIPYPGTFILDAAGLVVSKYFESDFRQRYTASDILVRQYGEKPGSTSQAAETKHLKLLSSASQTDIHWGQRIALTVDIDLKTGMHVYAPGVEGYIPIDWKIKATPAFTPHEVVYPASQKLYLKPIQETVPVYKGRLRLVQEITLGTDEQVKPMLSNEGDLVIEGALRYQACDARVCYLAQAVPLKWRLHYDELDRQRVPPEMQRKAPNR
jgi:AhpC/TSA family/Disulphide bond corrector protein DsbC